MANPWIKIEHATPDKPEVHQIAERLGIDPDAALGKVVRFWIWADQNASGCNALSVTRSLLDRVTGVTGFAEAIEEVGWLRRENGGILIPNFDRHNGQTAKQRALTSQRVASHRKRKCNDSVTLEALPEERRGDKSIPSPRKKEIDQNRGLATEIAPESLAPQATPDFLGSQNLADPSFPSCSPRLAPEERQRVKLAGYRAIAGDTAWREVFDGILGLKPDPTEQDREAAQLLVAIAIYAAWSAQRVRKLLDTARAKNEPFGYLMGAMRRAAKAEYRAVFG